MELTGRPHLSTQERGRGYAARAAGPWLGPLGWKPERRKTPGPARDWAVGNGDGQRGVAGEKNKNGSRPGRPGRNEVRLGLRARLGYGKREAELGRGKKKRSRPFGLNKRKGEFSLIPLQFLFLFQNHIQIWSKSSLNWVSNTLFNSNKNKQILVSFTK